MKPNSSCMRNSAVTDPDKELLAELLIRWEELYERGQDTPAAELAKEHPELIAELDRRIKVIKKVAWLDKPLDGDPDDPPGSPSSGSPSSPARTIAGRYRLDELIAEGGFAQVYRAYDKELQRTVAVKVPKPSKLESNNAFLAEARRAGRLKHDGIVPVHDVGTDGDTVFIVSEYLEGGSLADRLTQGKINQDDAIRWVTEIADALEYAHLNGVIHRDIKPANIVIDHHGRAKLTDFGIAQSASKSGSFAPSLGTLRYMAAEQLQGACADHRSDIYSLAVVLYEALTGDVPYSSSDPNVLRKEITGGVRKDWRTGIPSSLRPVLSRALSRRPHERPSSAAAFAAELRRSDARQKASWISGLLLVATLTGSSLFLIPKPKPLPYSGERQCWEGSNGVCFVHYPNDKQWKEQNEEGVPFFWFVENDRTPEYIELLDKSRDLLIRLYDDRVAVKSNATNDEWSVMRSGEWIAPSK
jgi:eukaryotic-like serine/threonine-protein kinase